LAFCIAPAGPEYGRYLAIGWVIKTRAISIACHYAAGSYSVAIGAGSRDSSKYPQAGFPYAQLIKENGRRGFIAFEYELWDTGIFDESRYFDGVVEYAKAGQDDMLMKIAVVNRGPVPAVCRVLPTVWFRNTRQLARQDSVYQDTAGKLFEHCLRIARAMAGDRRGGNEPVPGICCRRINWKRFVGEPLIGIDTCQPLHGFQLRLAINAISGGWPGFEPFNRYIFFTVLTESVITVFDILQGALDFSDQQLFPAAKAVGKIAFGDFSGPIQYIGQILVGFPNILQTAVGPAQ
jgi:hypothetical protein